jgi:hypothetical protein
MLSALNLTALSGPVNVEVKMVVVTFGGCKFIVVVPMP